MRDIHYKQHTHTFLDFSRIQAHSCMRSMQYEMIHFTYHFFLFRNEVFTKHKRAHTHIRTPPITMRRSNFQGPFFSFFRSSFSHTRNYLIRRYEYNGCDRERIETACSRRLTWTNQLRSTVFCLSINWQIKSLLLTMRFRPFEYSEWLALLQFI